MGLAICLLAALVIVFFTVAPSPPRVSRERRVAPGTEHVSLVARVTERTTNAIESAASKRRARLFGAEELELAGVQSTPSQFVVLVASSASVLALLGVILGLSNGTSIFWGLAFAILTPLFAKLLLSVRTSRRRARFADQIDDTVQLVAGSLRAGHGLSTSLGAVATDSPAPMGEELARAVNESRLGRPLPEALTTTAQRMQSKDFDWVAQAIGINAETGGNLAEVLDQVGKTIRERNQVRRQVAALSAEGRLSGLILVVLPIALFLFFAAIRPDYISVFFSNIIGIAALVLAALLLIGGSVWIAFTVRVKF
ncbi:type II secretion system F family protein [Agromyces sp. S2-1-8]|uniref:type II secretion system F family protein n=1 Tax=Agromyces sp. S2-1-8 TaxID=2897180 RepID=UPI001E5D2CBC|nr:type II secretion system F family protein [Agromyces sp. S2-1-8]MCD5344948.1 type II secretion system F family protein [Agromyces sp. S2-1-8]